MKKSIHTYSSFLESKSGKLYKYGCVMVYLDIPNWKSIISNISEEDLYKPEEKVYGKETDPHITLLYGLHKDVDDKDIIEMFKDYKSSEININVERIDIFENDEFDVVKMNVTSEFLTNMNKKLSTLPHTSDFPDYRPHITIAYIKKGCSDKYIQDNYKYTFNNINKIVYSKPNGEKIDISLK